MSPYEQSLIDAVQNAEYGSWADDGSGPHGTYDLDDAALSIAKAVEKVVTEKARRDALLEAATLVNGWHYKKGGYTELAERIRDMAKEIA